MTDWSSALTKHFGTKGPQVFNLINFGDVTDGQEFERRLGEFLQQVRGFRACKSLLEKTANLPGVPAPFLGTQSLPEWCRAVEFSLDSAINLIHESLLYEFGKRSCNFEAGRRAYSSLLSALGISPGTKKWVYVTTNYDRNAEKILENLGYETDVGASLQQIGGGHGLLSVRRLVEEVGKRRVPVLHLHGCVGWYQRPNGEIYHQVDGGAGSISAEDVPVVKLPELNKIYDSDDLVGETWNEFEQSLQRAKSVFILGHSLHDAALVKALQENVTPLERLAIGVNGTDKNYSQFGPGGEELSDRSKELFGSNVTIVPIHFGGNWWKETLSTLSDWKHDADN
jgi:hypothetical protein